MQASAQIVRVREALAADPDTHPFAHQLRIETGDPWRITGEVTSIAARRKAARVARRAIPAMEIEDGVRLAREIRQSDDNLAATLREALREEPALQGVSVLEPGSRPPPLEKTWIGVRARDGILYLGGWLDNLAAKAVAEGLAWETGACRDVKNFISHEPLSTCFDDEITSALRTLIDEHPRLPSQSIEVSVEKGVVIMKGVVTDPAQRGLAKSLGWFVPAVRDVQDYLRLASADEGAQSRRS